MQTRIRARRVCYLRARGYFIPVAIFNYEPSKKSFGKFFYFLFTFFLRNTIQTQTLTSTHRIKSKTRTRVGRFHKKKSYQLNYQLSYAQFTYHTFYSI
jgi:hypothetical protein